MLFWREGSEAPMYLELHSLLLAKRERFKGFFFLKSRAVVASCTGEQLEGCLTWADARQGVHWEVPVPPVFPVVFLTNWGHWSRSCWSILESIQDPPISKWKHVVFSGSSWSQILGSFVFNVVLRPRPQYSVSIPIRVFGRVRGAAHTDGNSRWQVK